MRIALLSILLFTSVACFTQNDTIYLNENYIERNGRKYNRIENDIKTGKWIEFTIENNTIVLTLASGENAHWHNEIFTEYRPLKQKEYCGIEIMTSQKVIGEIDGDTIYNGIYVKVVNKIPPDKYQISGEGIYKNNTKERKWTYLHKNGKLKKEIYYKNGLPEKGFYVYRPDKTIMIEVNKINKEDWEIIKYSESGQKLDRGIKKTNEIKALF